MIAREIDKEHPGLVQKIVTIGTPYGGFKMTPKFVHSVDDSGSLTPLYVVAGYNSNQKKWYMREDKNDGTVDLDSATDFGRPIEGSAIFAGVGHVDLIKSKRVANQIKSWIAQ